MEIKKLMDIKNYIDFLSQNKTERECVAFAERELRNHGFKSRKEFSNLSIGDKGNFSYFSHTFSPLIFSSSIFLQNN